MKIKEFVDLTAKVRVAHRRYFTGGRLQGDLIASKQLESKLDKALLEGVEPETVVHVHTTEDYQRELDFIQPVGQLPTNGGSEDESK